jgi:hypothetical protein
MDAKKRKESPEDAPAAPAKGKKAENAVAAVLSAESAQAAVKAALEAYPASALVAAAAFKKVAGGGDFDQVKNLVCNAFVNVVSHEDLALGAAGLSAVASLVRSGAALKDHARVAEVGLGVAKGDNETVHDFLTLLVADIGADLTLAAALEEFESNAEIVAKIALVISKGTEPGGEELVLALAHAAAVHSLLPDGALAACADALEALLARKSDDVMKGWLKSSRVSKVFSRRGVGKAIVDFVDK